MKYMITEVAPAVWGAGGVPLFNDHEKEVTETEFWDALQRFASRKQEIIDYLTVDPDRYVQVGEFRYSIKLI